MKKLNRLLMAGFILVLGIQCFSQVTYTKTIDVTFSGGNNGNFSGNMAADVVCTINSVDGLLDVAVNKINAPWSVLAYYMGNCWSRKIIFDQANRYIEFRVKCNAAKTTPMSVGSWGGCDGCCPQSKTWTNPTFTIPEADIWTIVLLKIPATTGGSQNIIDTISSFGLAWSLFNGNYSFDYVKIGTAAVPPIPTINHVNNKVVNDNAGVQNVNLTGISIPNRLIDGLTIKAESLSDGIIKDVTIIDLGSGPFAVDEATNIATAALQYTPVAGMGGLGDSIIITLKDTIRGTTVKSSFYVTLLGSCAATIPSASDVTICSGNTATLTAAGAVNYRWYNSSTGGTLLGSNASYTTPALTSTTVYYVANYNGTCESSRKAVSAIISGTIVPKITALANTHIVCNSAPEQLLATPTGGVFSGIGVEMGYFVPAQAKVNHMNSIYYTYGDTSSGCSGKDSTHVYVFPCIGLDDDAENEMKIYPNPFDGILNIDAVNVLSVQIIDGLGKVIFEDKNSGSAVYSKSVDLSSVPAGIYLINVMIDNKNITTRIIKK